MNGKIAYLLMIQFLNISSPLWFQIHSNYLFGISIRFVCIFHIISAHVLQQYFMHSRMPLTATTMCYNQVTSLSNRFIRFLNKLVVHLFWTYPCKDNKGSIDNMIHVQHYLLIQKAFLREIRVQTEHFFLDLPFIYLNFPFSSTNLF